MSKKRYERKDILDKFYTDRNTANQLVSCINFNLYDLVIEPSAGDGAFLDCIPANIEKIGIDILPGRNDILQCDFLIYEYSGKVPSNKILILGNPPFGKQNNLALKFIINSSKIADAIAFILPMSFNKPSVQNRVPLNFHIEENITVKNNSFLFEGETYDVPTVFQLWVKKIYSRKKSLAEEPKGWEYCDKTKANLAIRRVGYYAGYGYKNLDKNEQSHLFINVSNSEYIDSLVKYLTTYNWKHGDTVGPRTVSKHQLNNVINSFINS